jgi:hypothetical protein
MSPVTDWIDVGVKILGLAGGGLASWWGLRQWNEGQRWKKAERLDKLIAEFETSPTLRFATKVLDWEELRVQVTPGDVVKFTSEEIREALRIHWDFVESPNYPPPQDRIREALDALLAFFARLDREIKTHLIEAGAAFQHFGYWLYRLYNMREHAEVRNPEDAALVAMLTRRYETAYGDPDAMTSLYDKLQLTADYARWEKLSEKTRLPPALGAAGAKESGDERAGVKGTPHTPP